LTAVNLLSCANSQTNAIIAKESGLSTTVGTKIEVYVGTVLVGIL
jgi:hypothetical protein